MIQQPDTERSESGLFRRFMDLFVLPDVRRRQECGASPRPLVLAKFQILFSADGSRPLVRLNEEVKTCARVKLKEGVTKRKDEPVRKDEIEAIEYMDLPPDERDHAHFTAIDWDGVWLVSCNSVYNRGTAKQMVDLGQQFWEAARSALDRGHLRVFADNLFSAAELAARASVLCWFPDVRFKAKANHAGVITRYGQYAKAGNASKERLARERPENAESEAKMGWPRHARARQGRGPHREDRGGGPSPTRSTALGSPARDTYCRHNATGSGCRARVSPADQRCYSAGERR